MENKLKMLEANMIREQDPLKQGLKRECMQVKAYTG